MNNSYVILLCNLTDSMALPWAEAGYHVIMVDPQHAAGIHSDGNITRIGCRITEAADYIGRLVRAGQIAFVMGFPPCTDVAVSGSRWFEEKREKDPHFQARAALVAEQCRMIGMLSGAPWAFENPVSVFSSIFGKARHTFHPYQFTGLCLDDNYTKATCLWAGGGFVMPENKIHPQVQAAINVVVDRFSRMVPKRRAMEVFADNNLVAEFYPDNRIHDCPPSDERANIRSATPRGFSMAAFLSNAPHLRVAANDNKAGSQGAVLL